MPWGRRGQGNWPGAGPFSNLPPWERPGWRYGRGACWYLYGAPAVAPAPAALKAEDEVAMLNEQKNLMEEQLKAMQETLAKIQARLEEIKK